MDEKERDVEIIALWMSRPIIMRHKSDVVEFYSELRKTRPELLGVGAESVRYMRLLDKLAKYTER